jgi:ubiquitin-protein ligase
MNDQLISRNNEILLQFKAVAFRKRLKNELDRMYANYDQIDVEETEKGDAKVTVYKIENDDKLQTYGFVITRDYPFRPPVIFFQNRPYLDFLKTRYISKSGTDIFRKITGFNCFCCSSVNCGDNWSPGITLDKIIVEIQFFKKKKRDIVNKILADKIKARYLIDDIDLESWLF